MDTSLTTYDQYKLYTTDDQYFISSDSSSTYLMIDKSSNNITTTTKLPQTENITTIYGVIGIHQLKTSNCLIVATGRQEIAKIQGHKIYELTKYSLLPLSYLSSYHKDLLNSVLQIPSFYFSYTYNLFEPFQSIENNSTSITTSNFLWNSNFFDTFPSNTTPFHLHILHGFITRRQCSIQPPQPSNSVLKVLEIIIISRRSTKRVGRRYYVRGIDENGNVANFVETEQLVTVDNKTSSYVQVRGSVPLYWSQIPCIVYKPKIACLPLQEAQNAFNAHFEELKKRYTTVVAVSLMDNKGREKELGDIYEDGIKTLDDSTSLWRIDFHKEMKNGSDLVKTLKEIYSSGNFGQCIWVNGKVIKQQSGVFRTNCVDNLDRTNVCQSFFGRFVAEEFFKENNVISESDDIVTNKIINAMFVNAWADNGNAMSNQYTGTNALKNDITRTGVRTTKGMYDDGVNSIMRYVINNFKDGWTTDALNVFVGSTEGDEKANYKLDTLPMIAIGGMAAAALLGILCILFFLVTWRLKFGGIGVMVGLSFALFGFVLLSAGKKATIPPVVTPIIDYSERLKNVQHENNEDIKDEHENNEDVKDEQEIEEDHEKKD
ncbi:Phosphoinositide phosphatase [Entamoeba marina]